MEVGVFEVLESGLTFAGKVWAKGEVIDAKQVPGTIQNIWCNPELQQQKYGRFLIRPRPADYKAEVGSIDQAMGSVETAGAGIGQPVKVGRNPPPMGPGGEVGVSGGRRAT